MEANVKHEAMLRVLTDLVRTVEATGGVRYNEENLAEPLGDPDWLDIGLAYVDACQVLGREPKVQGAK